MYGPEENVPEECTRVEASNWVPDCDGDLDDENTCYDGKTQELRLRSEPQLCGGGDESTTVSSGGVRNIWTFMYVFRDVAHEKRKHQFAKACCP
eukprot:scaffold26225_cov147-Cylindrotheca_fusiformis.AAC.1